MRDKIVINGVTTFEFPDGHGDTYVMSDTPKIDAFMGKYAMDHCKDQRLLGFAKELERRVNELELILVGAVSEHINLLAKRDGFIATVPDECDRIVWRGHYYHLPHELKPKEIKVVLGGRGERDDS